MTEPRIGDRIRATHTNGDAVEFEVDYAYTGGTYRNRGENLYVNGKEGWTIEILTRKTCEVGDVLQGDDVLHLPNGAIVVDNRGTPRLMTPRKTYLVLYSDGMESFKHPRSILVGRNETLTRIH